MSIKEYIKDFVWSIKCDFQRSREESRWKASGDYDKCFWDYVHQLRSRPDANPDSPLFVGDLKWSSKLPHFLAQETERIKRWVEIASTTFKEDPLTQLIVGETLGGVIFIGGYDLLEIERLCLIAIAYLGMHRNDRAIKFYELALEKATSIKDQTYVEICRENLAKLKQSFK